MNSKVVIPSGKDSRGMMTAMKIVGLVAVTWGVVFPVLFWSFNHLIN